MTLATNNLTDEVGTGSPDFPNGMPTSAGDPIVESGSNSDGEWTRFADGTQIYKSAPVDVVCNSGGSVVTSFTYPAAFISAPCNYATHYNVTDTGSYAQVGIDLASSTTLVMCRFGGGASYNAKTVRLQVSGYGR